MECSQGLLLTNQAAQLLGLSPETIRRLEGLGRLPAVRTSGGVRVRLFRRADVEALRHCRVKNGRHDEQPDASEAVV